MDKNNMNTVLVGKIVKDIFWDEFGMITFQDKDGVYIPVIGKLSYDKLFSNYVFINSEGEPT